MTETSKAPDLFSLAIPVSERVEILNVLINESRIKRAGDERFSQPDFSLKHDYFCPGVEKQEASQSIAVRLSFLLHSIRDGKPEEDPTIWVESTFVLIYKIDSFEGIEEENLKAFALTNGVYNAWPYWREYVQSMTFRMGLPPIVAPVFRFLAAKNPPDQQNLED
jgi:hypothetical protein